MGKSILLAAVASIATIPTAANATVTLIMGNNGLTTQIHLDPSHNNTATNIVQGLTKPGNVPVSFTSTSLIDGTGGSGYAQITDSTTVDNIPWTNLTIFLTNGGGFTAYEFSIDYAAHVVGKKTPAYLTIGYDLVGGGSGSFTFNASDPVLKNLMFTNSANTDFRLDATGPDVISHVYLTSTLPIFEEKQNDITIAPAPPPGVPEPATWAMMLAGFGVTGFAMRRTRRKNLLAQIA
jgi:hypothetical protein